MQPQREQKPWYRIGNPTMREDRFTNCGIMAGDSADPMTMNGVIAKTGLLLMMTFATGAVGWLFPSMPLVILTALVAFGTAIFVSFKPDYSHIGGPIYALFKGYALGAISVLYASMFANDKTWSGIVPLALGGTMVVFTLMLALYRTRVIKVTETFKGAVIGATLAIFLFYAFVFFGGMFFPGLSDMGVFKSGPIGIIFSIVVIGIAALNLALDFDLIERGIESKAPRKMEWYAGFALLVTLAWLYLEILRLLAKIAGNSRR
ncbi:MAG: Bax inhibitor-1/YccA family protein [Armatimonadetes bacterium]|nr:Bax inhibitor-1/YccA family protein [Armatimonadota bacterium]